MSAREVTLLFSGGTLAAFCFFHAWRISLFFFFLPPDYDGPACPCSVVRTGP